MTFADLKLGDHFIWPFDARNPPDSVNINVKIAWSEDGSGFAIDMATRKDCFAPGGSPPNSPLREYIGPSEPVIKLNGTF